MKVSLPAIPFAIPVAGAVLAALLLASCGKGKSDGPDRGRLVSSRAKHPLEKKFAHSDEDIKRTKDGTFTGGKRSEYDGAGSVSFGGDFRKSQYRTATFQSGGWTGNTTAVKKRYGGNTDGSRYKSASGYDERAHQAGRRSRFDRKTAGTSSYRSGPAAESTRTHPRQADPYTSSRRDNTPPPTIWSKEEYEKLSVEHTRSLLGRDD